MASDFKDALNVKIKDLQNGGDENAKDVVSLALMIMMNY